MTTQEVKSEKQIIDKSQLEKGDKGDDKENVTELSPLKPPSDDNNEKEKNEPKKKLTIIERIKLIKKYTTVEPIMACYVMPSVLASLATQNLNLEKACRVNLNYSDEVCTALSMRETKNYTSYEANVQLLTASVQGWKNVVQTAIPVLLILFVGAWSDKTGRRKACILMPIFGELLTCIGFIINTYFYYELPVEVAALTESFFPAITGGYFTNFVGVFSYIGDITTPEERTFRVGIVNLCMMLGYPVGSALSGVLLNCIGYYGIYSLSSTLYLGSLIYGYYYLEDVKKKPADENSQGGCIGFFKEFFDVKLVAETFKVAFKKGPDNKRTKVVLLLIGVFVVNGPYTGEYTILYLFTRFRFNWDEIQFSIWSTYSILTNLSGTIFSIGLFSSYLKLDDTILGIISNASKIVASVAYAFARNDLEIYLAPLLEILTGTSYIALRSIASKLVSGQEFGKVNSLLGLVEAVLPIIYGPVYSKVYRETLHTLPGAVFLMSAALTLPSLVTFGWMYFEQMKSNTIKDKIDAEKQPADQQIFVALAT